MESLPFTLGTFDLIWSEGAISHIGFERGMREWSRFLKPGGHIAVSEFTWLTRERPAEIEKYATDNGIAPATVMENLLIMEQAGYQPLAHSSNRPPVGQTNISDLSTGRSVLSSTTTDTVPKPQTSLNACAKRSTSTTGTTTTTAMSFTSADTVK